METRSTSGLGQRTKLFRTLDDSTKSDTANRMPEGTPDQPESVLKSHDAESLAKK